MRQAWQWLGLSFSYPPAQCRLDVAHYAIPREYYSISQLFSHDSGHIWHYFDICQTRCPGRFVSSSCVKSMLCGMKKNFIHRCNDQLIQPSNAKLAQAEY
jgi:hypothetical protein